MAEVKDKELKKQKLAAAVNWARRVKVDGKEVAPTVILDSWVSEGYNQLKTQRRGAAKVYRLENTEGCGYTLRRKVEAEYVSLLPGVVVHEFKFKEAVATPSKETKAGFVAVDYESFFHDAEAVRNADRTKVVNAVLSQPQIYPVEGDYKYLVGKTRFNTAIFVVWDEPLIDRAIMQIIGQEIRHAGLNYKIKIYGHAMCIFSDWIEFIQLPLMRRHPFLYRSR